MFYSGHDVIGAWEQIKQASADDSFSQEVATYFNSLWKDSNTNKDLPFITLKKGSYNETSEWLINRKPQAAGSSPVTGSIDITGITKVLRLVTNTVLLQ